MARPSRRLISRRSAKICGRFFALPRVADAELNEGGMVAGDEYPTGAVALIAVAFGGFQQGMFGGELEVF